LYEKVYTIPEEQWSFSDSLDFAFEIKDTDVKYNMYLDIIHHPDYPFQNMYVLIHSIFPDGRRVTDQQSLELQEKGGTWIGGCRGSSCEVRFIMREKLRFEEAGLYTIVLQQYSRRDPMEGIKKVGLVLEKDKG
jgi:gliding motility-associated lipoprotein GldH